VVAKKKKNPSRPWSGIQAEVHPNAQDLFNAHNTPGQKWKRDQILVSLLVALSYVE